ncbi:MAG TPA: hypothetical protein VEZ90_06195, partial [Blastocatellia bacterium]|nr:hypothetical protein [Blastocatellia bacterium]
MKARFEKMAKLIVVSCVATLALSTVAAAQTSDQVLRLWVGFNTLRNSKAVDPATKSEVDALDKKAIAANAAGNYGAAMDDYYHAIALLNGQAWTASRAVSFALNIDLSHALLEPGQTVSVTVKENYKPDLSPPGPLAGNLTLLDQKGDQAASLGSAPNANPDLKSHPLTLTAAIPAVADGNYRLHFVLTPASGDPITKDADIRVEKGLLKRAMEVSDEAQSLYSKLKAAHKSDLADALETVRYHIELCKLADAQKLNPSKVNFDAEIAKSEEELRALESGKDPFSLQHGDFRRAYLSKVDDTLQPYRIYVPIAYDASRPYPLIIALHGMGG